MGKEFKIAIPRGDILAMKAETWYKVRKLIGGKKNMNKKTLKTPKIFQRH